MKNILIVLAAFTVITVSAGCKKNGEDEAINRRQLLTNDVWILTGITFTKSGSSAPEDIFTNIDACAKDDEFHYLPAESSIIQTEMNHVPASRKFCYQATGTFLLMKNRSSLPSIL